MSYVHVLHQKVVGADNGLAFRRCTARDCYVLADRVVVADNAGRLLATELEVLRLCRDTCAGEELVVAADACTYMDGNTVLHYVVVADFYITVDVAERTDDVVIAKLCFGMYVC